MTDADGDLHSERMTELEFDLGESDVFLRRVSGEVECDIEVEMVVPRSDGTVLEFLEVTGADPEDVLASARETEGIERVRLIDRWDGGGLFELVSATRIATAIADEGALFTRITARSGQGRLEAEVPSHLDTGAVVEAFLAEYPDAELVAKRETEREAPLLSSNQLVARLLDDLTDKQLQALRVAHANGFFRWPRDTRAADIAEQLEVSTPTFSQHLRAAEGKVFDALFE